MTGEKKILFLWRFSIYLMSKVYRAEKKVYYLLCGMDVYAIFSLHIMDKCEKKSSLTLLNQSPPSYASDRNEVKWITHVCTTWMLFASVEQFSARIYARNNMLINIMYNWIARVPCPRRVFDETRFFSLHFGEVWICMCHIKLKSKIARMRNDYVAQSVNIH